MADSKQAGDPRRTEYDPFASGPKRRHGDRYLNARSVADTRQHDAQGASAHAHRALDARESQDVAVMAAT